jgi:hypothetical protein
MKTSIVYVGMDIHKESITMAMLMDGSESPVTEKHQTRLNDLKCTSNQDDDLGATMLLCCSHLIIFTEM